MLYLIKTLGWHFAINVWLGWKGPHACDHLAKKVVDVELDLCKCVTIVSSVICIQSFIYLLYTFVTCSHVCMKCFRKEKEQQQDPDQLHSVLRTILQQVKVSCCIFGLEITLFSISFFESSYGHIKYCELSYYKTVPIV